MYDDNLQVYGARKVWRQLRREDVVVAHCTVAQLMREMGIAGVVRGTPNRTTTGEETAGPHRPGQRDFTAPAPNVLWVADDGQTTWVGHEHDGAPGDALAGTSADRTA